MAEDVRAEACRACAEILARAACLERWAGRRRTPWFRVLTWAAAAAMLLLSYVLVFQQEPAWAATAVHYLALAAMAGAIATCALPLWYEGRGPWRHLWLALAVAVVGLWAWSVLEAVGALPVRLGTVMAALDGTMVFILAAFALWVKMGRRERDFHAMARTLEHLKGVCERALPALGKARPDEAAERDAATVTEGLRNAGHDPLPWPWSRRMPALRSTAAARVEQLAAG